MKQTILIITAIAFLGVASLPAQDPSPTTTPTPTASPSATPLPSPTPSATPAAQAAQAPAMPPWLIPETTSGAEKPGESPRSTVLRSRVQPVVIKQGDTWITVYTW